MDEVHSFSVAGRKMLALPAKVECDQWASSFHLVLEQTGCPLSCSFQFALGKELFEHRHTHPHTHTLPGASTLSGAGKWGKGVSGSCAGSM